MKYCLAFLAISIAFLSCSKKEAVKDEQIVLKDTANSKIDTAFNTIQGNISFSQISSTPQNVVLTGLNEHRLVTIYKTKPERKQDADNGYSYSRSYEEEYETSRDRHFMPGLDLIYGYNLLNVAHYDLTTEKLNFLFDRPVLIKSLYYPSFVQDSLFKKPINRNYYLVSAYDADTSGDTLITKNDLRRFYYFNASGVERIQLIPEDYSVERSQYDSKNDVMYVFARQDVNKDGKAGKKEPLHIFWFSLKQPAVAKKLY